MSAESSAPLARLVTTAEAVEGLRDLFAAEEPLDVVAGRVAETAVAAIPHADVVSITVLSWPDVHTAACTDEHALEIDDRQYASGHGPCLEAAARETVTHLETALLSRSDIDMAKGALIAIHGCDPPGAFARLRVESQRRNTKLRDVARAMLVEMQTKS